MNLINYVYMPLQQLILVHKCGYCPPVLTHFMIILFKYDMGCGYFMFEWLFTSSRESGGEREGGEDGRGRGGMREIGREIM